VLPLFLLASLLQSAVVESVKVEGAHAVPVALILAAANLQPGATVSKPDLDAAVRRLMDSGQFVTARYRYQPGPNGWTVTLTVAEEQDRIRVRLEAPGTPEADLWRALHASQPLLIEQAPVTALDRYKTAFAAWLKSPVAEEWGETEVRLRPAGGPVVTMVEVSGNALFSDAILRKALLEFVEGRQYEPAAFARFIEMAWRPLYERQGYLQARFAAPRTRELEGGSLALIAAVEEGSRFLVGAPLVDPPSLKVTREMKWPEGEVADWTLVRSAALRIQDPLAAEGYLEAKSKVEPRFRPGSTIVDVAVTIDRGRQFTFGSVAFEGMSPANEKKARALFALRPGMPLNQHYVENFVGELYAKMLVVAPKASRENKVRAGTTVVDIVYRFGK
jgi:outer membrane protein assembly factor BamA